MTSGNFRHLCIPVASQNLGHRLSTSISHTSLFYLGQHGLRAHSRSKGLSDCSFPVPVSFRSSKNKVSLSKIPETLGEKGEGARFPIGLSLLRTQTRLPRIFDRPFHELEDSFTLNNCTGSAHVVTANSCFFSFLQYVFDTTFILWQT